MSQPCPLVAFIILNWNRLDLTLACLQSLQTTTYPNYRVYVVDSGSSDGSVPVLAARTDIIFIPLPENLGFVGGNNVGLQRALDDGAEWLFLLNNDTTVAPDMLIQMMAVAEQDPRAGIVGAKVLYHDHPDTIWMMSGRLRLPWGYFGRPPGFGEVDRGQWDAPCAVDWLSGCALMIRRILIEQIGLLGDGYFSYYEDVDWCLRARRTGWRLRVAPRANVWHKVSSSTGGEASPATVYYMMRNRALLWQRCPPDQNRFWMAVRSGVTLLESLMFVFSIKRRARSGRLASLRAMVYGWRDARAGRFGPMPPEVARLGKQK